MVPQLGKIIPGRSVYIAGPFSSDPAGNTVRACEVADTLRLEGYHPFVPHVACDWAAKSKQGGYEAAMDECMYWLAKCELVLRIPGDSPGADREVERARFLAIPVYFSIAEVIANERA